VVENEKDNGLLRYYCCLVLLILDYHENSVALHFVCIPHHSPFDLCSPSGLCNPSGLCSPFGLYNLFYYLDMDRMIFDKDGNAVDEIGPDTDRGELLVCIVDLCCLSGD